MNPLVLILLLGVGAFAANAAVTSNTGNKSSIKLLNIVSFKTIGTEFEIVASIAIDNPTTGSIKLKKPYLKLFYNENEIGTSVPSEEFITIKANGRTPGNVNLRIPFSSVPVLVMAAFNGKGSEQTIGIEVATKANGLPIKDKRDYKIADLLKLLKK